MKRVLGRLREGEGDGEEQFAVSFLRRIALPDDALIEDVFGPERPYLFTRSEGEFGQLASQLGHWWTDAEQRKYLGDDADVLEKDMVMFDAKEHKSYRFVRARISDHAERDMIFCVDMFEAYKVLEGVEVDALQYASDVERFKRSEFGKQFMHFAEVFKAGSGLKVDIPKRYPLLAKHIFCVKYQTHQFETKYYSTSDEDETLERDNPTIGVSSFSVLDYKRIEPTRDDLEYLKEEGRDDIVYVNDWMGGLSEGTFIVDPSKTLVLLRDKRKVRPQRLITEWVDSVPKRFKHADQEFALIVHA